MITAIAFEPPLGGHSALPRALGVRPDAFGDSDGSVGPNHDRWRLPPGDAQAGITPSLSSMAPGGAFRDNIGDGTGARGIQALAFASNPAARLVRRVSARRPSHRWPGYVYRREGEEKQDVTPGTWPRGAPVDQEMQALAIAPHDERRGRADVGVSAGGDFGLWMMYDRGTGAGPTSSREPERSRIGADFELHSTSTPAG